MRRAYGSFFMMIVQ